VKMLDIGIINRRKRDYQTKFLNELVPGEEISGDLYIGEIKKRTLEKSESFEFFVILTDHEKKKKWVCKLITSYYPETGNIYGERGGRVYTFVDTLNHVINNEPLNTQDSYSVHFNTFRNAINDNISRAKVNAAQPVNPHAKYVNLEVVSAESSAATSPILASSLEELAEKDALIHISYANLRAEGKEPTVQNIAFELKSMLDRDEITELEFKNALKKMDTLGKDE
jgi:hypothetical protein